MKNKNFARVILRKTPKTLLIAIFLMTFSLASAHIVEEEGGFALKISRECFPNIFSNLGSFTTSEDFQEYSGDQHIFTEKDHPDFNTLDSKVEYTIITHVNARNSGDNDEANNDLGFGYFATAADRFVNLEWGDKPMKIKSIVIKWSEFDLQAGGLRVMGRNDVPYPDDKKYSISAFANEAFEEEYFFYSKEANETLIQSYVFNNPVDYIAVQRDIKTINDFMARFEWITIHFIDESSPKDETATELTLCKGEEKVSLPWTKEAATIKNIVSIEGEENLESELEEMKLQFYLTPEFEPTERPDSEGDKVDWMTDGEWYLFTLLEEEKQIYDGFLTVDRDDENKIKCDYDPVSNILTLPAVCSGLYCLSVESDNTDITSNNVHLNIYPDISHTYSFTLTDDDNLPYTLNYEFSLNGVTFGQDLGNKGTLGYPYADKENQNMGAFGAEAVDIDIPGLYNAELYYLIEFQDQPKDDGPSDLGKRGINREAPQLEGYTPYSEKKPSLEDLTESNTAKLQLKIVKNGAETPNNENDESVHTLILKLDASVDIPTAVETIDAEFVNSGKARYYNLNGVEVNSRNLASGIYIKVENGKAEKMVIR